MSGDAESAMLREMGRTFAARRRTVVSTCASCGKPIEGITLRRYCSAACRTRAHRLRKERAAHGEPPTESTAPLPPGSPTGIQAAAVARLLELRDAIIQDRTFRDPSRILREQREARTRHISGTDSTV